MELRFTVTKNNAPDIIAANLLTFSQRNNWESYFNSLDEDLKIMIFFNILDSLIDTEKEESPTLFKFRNGRTYYSNVKREDY